MLAALREMLCLAEEKAKQDRKTLENFEDTFHNEHRRWNDIFMDLKWKAQRDLLEDERDKLEERFDLSMSKAKDNEKRIEEIWREKERNFAEESSLKKSITTD